MVSPGLWKAESNPPLAVGEVHVWAAELDHGSEAAADRLLSPEERERAARFYFPRDRRRFAAARAGLRVLLGRYLKSDPSVLTFGYGPQGKPRVPGVRLRFNVSHSGGRALLAFALDRELGVDLEQERPLGDALALAERYFAPAETRVLRGLPESEIVPAFFRCWTRKEAYMKATGDGLTQPLDAFEVSLAPGEPARLLHVNGRPAEKQPFQLESLEPGAGFAAAVAVEGPVGPMSCFRLEDCLEETHGARRARGQDDLQGGREPRRAVFDLARRPGQPAGLA
jgi:4'-phosphopantetheinyl transferase